jgi:CHAT domain-containing protein/Tfp pilus assembly protein PilF
MLNQMTPIANQQGGGWSNTRRAVQIINLLLWAGLSASPCLWPGAEPVHASTSERAAAPNAQESISLEPDKPVERELSGGQSHSYKITMISGQYLHVVVAQRGIDVAVTTLTPDGKKIIELNSDPLIEGAETMSVIAEAPGAYLIEVRSPEKTARTGRYEIKVEELRTATARDKYRVAGELVCREAGRLQGGTLEDKRKSIEKYHEALDSYRRASDRNGEAQTLNNIGEVYWLLGELRKALEKYNEALPISRAAGDRRGEARTLHNIGQAHWSLGEMEKALEKYNEALLIRRAVGDRNGEAQTLHNIGQDYWSQGNMRKALEKYNEALPIRRTVGDRKGEAFTLNNIGVVYWSQGEMRKALEKYNETLPIFQELGDRRGEAAILGNIGTVYTQLGEMSKAFEKYNEALPISRAIGDRRLEAQTLHNIGQAYWSLGEAQKALENYNEALSLRRAIGDRREEAGTLHNIGAVYQLLGEMRKALGTYNEALQIVREVSNHRGEVVTLNNIGEVYWSLGEMRKALEKINESLSLSRAIDDRRGQAYALSQLGRVYQSLGELRKALEKYNEALPIRRAVDDRRGEAQTLHNIGQAHWSLGEMEKALEKYNEALSLRRAVGDRNGEAETLLEIARVEQKHGDLPEARQTVEQAIGIIEPVRASIASQELRASYSSSRQEYYESYINILIEQHKQNPATGFDAVAFEVSERARARSLLELLRESRIDIRQGVDGSLLERERSLQQRLNARAAAQVSLLNRKHTPEEADAAAKEIDAITAECEEVQARIRARSPRYAALTQPRPLSLTDIQQQALDRETLLLEYSLGENASHLFVVSQTSLSWRQLPKRTEIEAAAQRVYELLTAPQPRPGESAAESQARIKEARESYWTKAAELSRMLLGPVASQLGKKRLVIVADGALQYIPFAALPAPSPGNDGGRNSGAEPQPLFIEHEIVSLPSASTLTTLRRETSGRKPAEKSLAVLADPVFTDDDTRVRRNVRKAGAIEKTRSADPAEMDVVSLQITRSGRETGVIGGKGGFGRLLSTRREAAAISALVPERERRQALDFEASRTTALRPELGEYRIVHFATHGLLNNVHPELSGIVLSLVDKDGHQQDGFLRLQDVYNLKLPAELVVLSACQTGLGKEIKGEGLIGLTRGFMYAGAPRIVASLWKVDDWATSELMKRFYQGMLGPEALSPAGALRQAQLSIWKEKQWRAPYYWAAFVLQGEWK